MQVWNQDFRKRSSLKAEDFVSSCDSRTEPYMVIGLTYLTSFKTIELLIFISIIRTKKMLHEFTIKCSSFHVKWQQYLSSFYKYCSSCYMSDFSTIISPVELWNFVWISIFGRHPSQQSINSWLMTVLLVWNVTWAIWCPCRMTRPWSGDLAPCGPDLSSLFSGLPLLPF